MAATIKKGSRGDDVKTAQTILNNAGFNCGEVDGIFGSKTEAATRAYQAARGLVVDGVIGAKTWAALNAEGAKTASTEPNTEHFKLSEFDCHDGTKVPAQYYGNLQSLMKELEKIRAIWNKPITIRSGYRTLAYNRAIGNTTDHSQHLTANAADIVVKGVPAATVYAKLDSMYPNQGVGKYNDFTHIDLRGYRARW
jgi:zinc D-Ala-D-Ala carboxypeptidase